MDGDPQAPRTGALKARLQIGAALAIVSLVLGGALSFRAVNQARVARQQTARAQDVLRGASELRFLYAQAQSDLRGHVLSGEESFRGDFRADVEALHEKLVELQAQTGDDPLQQQALQALATEFQAREAQFARTLAEYERGGVDAVMQFVTSSANSTAAATRARDLLEQVRTHERTKFAALTAEDLDRQAQLTLWVALFFGLAVLIALWLTWHLARELDARARAERQLRWQHYFSDAILENLPVMLTIKDAATLALVRVNKAMERMTGMSRETLLRKDDRQLIPSPAGEARFARERAFVDANEGELLEEFTFASPQGERILAIRKVVLSDENGKPAFLVGTATDITDRLETERRLRQFSEDLAQKTRALEAANRELESFSYSVSHDLRAPLRAVDGYAAILEEDYAGAFDDEGRRYLRAVREGAARMGQLIQDLLTFSRLSRQEFVPQPVATRTVVDAAWQDVRTTAASAARVALHIDDLPPSNGDPRLLQRVWTNLLENAVKYSSKTAQPAVHVSGRTEAGETVFTVADNGAGFDMRYYDKLFQVFQRLHRESDYPGTGVGLAIVQRIVTRHGGRVWADGAPGRGARFSFCLPPP